VRTNAPLATLGPLLHALAAHIRDPAFVAALLLKLQALPVPPAVPPASETAFEEKLEAMLNADEGLGRVRAQEALARGLLVRGKPSLVSGAPVADDSPRRNIALCYLPSTTTSQCWHSSGSRGSSSRRHSGG